jgi:tRNA (mo5U34)-methyltransferase
MSLSKDIGQFPYWYHRIELPGGVVTPGWAPIDPAAYKIPESLAGKRVLDVGAWDGYWTFEALKRGASQVVAIDDFSDYLGNLKEEDRRAWATFDFCRDALGHDSERCQRKEMSVYDVSETMLGRFDVVFFFGTLYHLRYPLLALDRLAAVTNELLCVETAILDDYSVFRGGFGKGYGRSEVVMEFYAGNEYGGNDTNWWVPNLNCLVRMMAAAGFSHATGWKLKNAPDKLPDCRGFAQGRRQQPPSDRSNCVE